MNETATAGRKPQDIYRPIIIVEAYMFHVKQSSFFQNANPSTI